METPPGFRFDALPGAGVTLHVARAGPDDGPPVLLLHGFPEFWYGWRHQLAPLAAAGLQVLAPDQRGYNRSDKPTGTRPYALDALADDALALIDATGRTRAAVVGHDWGGVVAWHLAVRHPDRVERLAVLNAPHPALMKPFLLRHPSQLLRSWYVFAFQVPRLPEALLGRDRGAPLARSLQASSRPGTFAADELEHYRQAWSEPGALTGMLAWYRAALRHPVPNHPPNRLPMPALILWGERDRFLRPELGREALGLCDQGQLEAFPDATHCLHHEEPARVNRLLLDFLT